MEKQFSGKIWKLGDDIDTDVIMMTKYLAIPTLEEMSSHAFEPIRPELAGKIKPGDILVAGKNFGCGSSREAAAGVLKTLGLKCVIAKSFGKIFFRNAINNGLLLIECKDLYENCEEGDEVTVVVNNHIACNGNQYEIPVIGEEVYRILEDGGLVASMKNLDKTSVSDDCKEKPYRGIHIGGHTLAEQIIINNIGHSCKPGDIVTVNVDSAILHDIYAPYIFNQFVEMGFEKVYNTEKVVMMQDHMYPNCNYDDARCFRYCNRFQDEYGVKHIHVSDGICHQIVAEEGYALPGSMCFGTDSHTTTYGAFGSFASGVGYTEMASIIGTGKLWMRVPSAIKVIVNGTLPKGVFAKDIILRLLKDIRTDGGIYKSIEFCGTAIEQLSIASRMSIANMAVECGAKAALFAPDQQAAEFFGLDYEEIKWLHFDEDAVYERVLEYQADEFEPYMACPTRVDNVHALSEVEGIAVDQVFLGSCTNGRLEDLEIAAKILEGKKINPFVKFIVTPASKKVYKEALKRGYIKTLISAGAMLTHPYCSLCQGRSGGLVSDDEVVIGTHNRNFIGRMGSPKARTYLASPAVAATAALTGKITNPVDFL